jgi:hypothetical protein
MPHHLLRSSSLGMSMRSAWKMEAPANRAKGPVSKLDHDQRGEANGRAKG